MTPIDYDPALAYEQARSRRISESILKAAGREPGYVALFRGKGVVGRLIRWQTRSEYSHAALLLADGETVIESREFQGVRRHVLSADEKASMDVFEVPGLDAAGWERVFSYAESKLGARYDWRAVFSFVTRKAARLNDKWFCSELVCAAFAVADHRLLERMPCHDTNPGHLRLSARLSGPVTL